MDNLTPAMLMIKEKMKGVWSSGDFGVVAKIIEDEEQEFLNLLNIPRGSKVLDVACGNGNFAVPAAINGAEVTGIDLVEDLIRQAKERAAAHNLNIRFDVGDAEDLPYKDNEFDYVISIFGAMFAPRPELTANELLRVCRPGGKIVMGNWTPSGFINDFFLIGSKYLPPPPGIEPPSFWGDESKVRERFGSRISDLKTTKRKFDMKIPLSPADSANHYIEYFGPVKVLYNMLDPEKRISYKNEFTQLWELYNKGSRDYTRIEAEYLQVIAVKK